VLRADHPGDPEEIPPGEAWPAGAVPPRHVLLTFNGMVTMQPLVHGVTYYRPVGAGSVAAGCWWTPTPPTTDARMGLAIKGNWNSMTGVVQFQPAPGFVIPGWHGAAAAQALMMSDGRPGYLTGGADIIWVPWGALTKDKGTFTIGPMPA
jgi:hypothetical protein